MGRGGERFDIVILCVVISHRRNEKNSINKVKSDLCETAVDRAFELIHDVEQRQIIRLKERARQ